MFLGQTDAMSLNSPIRKPRNCGLETTCLVMSSYSGDFTWEALSECQSYKIEDMYSRWGALFLRGHPRGQ